MRRCKFQHPSKRLLSTWEVRDVVYASSAEEYNQSCLTTDLQKYYYQRYRLFSLYDQGILMDGESWHSVTPEKIAIHHSLVLKGNLVVDGFGGCGGNTIQFAKTCNRVISIDIDPIKIHLAKTNSAIYGVASRIRFVQGDFFTVLQNFEGYSDGSPVDHVFLAPPWGGPEYLAGVYNVFSMMNGIGLTRILQTARLVSSNVAVAVPRNTPFEDLVECGRQVGANECRIEQNYLNNKLKLVTAYYRWI